MFDLTKIKDPSFVKELNKKQLKSLADEIRIFLIDHVSKAGGHLSSNLGVVELTIAMHYVFSSPKDKLLFDVGHQCYTHKILTGRAKDFDNLRSYGGLSGFIRREESLHDIWESGHSSTSISAQCGFLLAQDVLNEDRVVVLIGDASLTNGVSFEALNYMGSLKNKNPIIILNDNKMSISRSVGALTRSFSKLRSSKFYRKANNLFAKISPRPIKNFFHSIKSSIKGLILKENLFEDWGYDYMGPYDGNDLSVCIKTLNAAKELNKPCVIHFVTKKGKGYAPAENDKTGSYHAVSKFDKESGKIIHPAGEGYASFARIASFQLKKMIAQKETYVINPAMIKSSHLTDLQYFYPQNIIDVGMAEEHATVMASAMAQAGKSVVLMLYSTFSQRAYDFILNDIARTSTPLIIALDQADIVSETGDTHQGIYDLSMWGAMPNLQVVMPCNGEELCALFEYASKQKEPVVIRYNKGYTKLPSSEITIEKVSWSILKEGKDAIIITYGNNVDYVLDALKETSFDVEVVNARFIRPMDEECLNQVLKSNKPVLIYENCVRSGSLADNIYRYIIEHQLSVKIDSMSLDNNALIPCGDVESIKKHFKLSKKDIIERLHNLLK